jgi:O-antigen/teichoic acid export membrane protein
LLLPIFAKMIKDRERIGPIVQLSYSLIIAPAVIIAFSCLFYNVEIMQVLYKSNSDESARILGVLMLGLLGIMTTYIFGTLLTANGSLKQLNIMASLGMVLNILLNLLLIPRLMAIGAAWASLTTQFSTAIAQLIIALVVFKLKIDWRYIGRMVVFVLLYTLVGFLSRLTGNWLYGFAAMIATGVLIALFIKLINVRDLIGIILYNR